MMLLRISVQLGMVWRIVFLNESIVSFKAAFQRPDVSAPSFSKADFHKIIDALG